MTVTESMTKNLVTLSLVDAFPNQIQVALEWKKLNVANVKPEPTRPSGNPSPRDMWCRITSNMIFDKLKTARISCAYQSNHEHHDVWGPSDLKFRRYLKSCKRVRSSPIHVV